MGKIVISQKSVSQHQSLSYNNFGVIMIISKLENSIYVPNILKILAIGVICVTEGENFSLKRGKNYVTEVQLPNILKILAIGVICVTQPG